MDRIPYLIKRWKRDISIAVFLEEKDIPQLETVITKFTSLKRIVFSFYIRKTITPSNTPYYRKDKTNVKYFDNGLYPMNIMRDMAIESVETTHYLLLDIDTFISTTLEQDIENNKHFLSNHFNTLVFQIFQFSKTVNQTICRLSGDCGYLKVAGEGCDE